MTIISGAKYNICPNNLNEEIDLFVILACLITSEHVRRIKYLPWPGGTREAIK